MDGDLLSPKRKRTGRSSSLKKSNANYIAKSSSQCGGNGGAALPRAEILIGGDDSPSANGYSMQEDSPRQGDSPSKARRYSGPTNGLNRSINEIRRNINASSKSGVKKKDANVTLSGRREEEPTSSGAAVSTESSPPRSPISLTHSQINTTVDSSSMGKKCDDTLFSFLHSPESPPYSSFLREAANERKASNGIEERERWNSQRGVSENSRQQSKHGKGEIRLISISDYSPSIPCRKGNYGIPTAASSSANAALGSVIKRPSFSCPGSENLRHTQPVEDEWRSSFEGEDGESDEEEKSSNISAAVMDNMRLRLSARPAFGQINSRSNFLLNDDDHRQMDSNMSSMALHVGKDILKGRMKSRTIFDCEPLSSEDCRPHFFLRGNKAGSRSRENLISDDSTSFVDALTQGNDDVDINFGSRRQSFTTDIRNPFLCDEDGDTGRADTSSFEEAESSGIEGWKSPPSRGRRERGGFNLFSSSFSPENNLLTPARSAGADAASMGDLGTPVTEVGSPADIDMGASYEPYVEGEEENGIFGYSTSNHSRHESDFLPCRINDCAMGPETSTPSRFRRTDYNDQRQLVLSQAALSSADNIVTGVRQHEAAESKECPYDSSDERAANIVQNDGVYSVRSSSTDKDASTFEGALRYGSSYNSPADGITRNFIGASPRFRPDQSAFDRGKNSSVGLGLGPGGKDCPSTPMRPPSNCPATPLRTPSWATDRTATYISDEERDRLGDRDREGDHHAALTRQNSLTVNKVLLSLSTTLDSADVSFHRDFEQEGFLGSGTFADVYRAREKDGKSYAVKKSKRQFRSKKDRNLLMVEVMIMKRLGEAPCPYIVQLVRAWQEDGYFFVQIDLAERGTLKDLLTDLAAKRSRPEDATVWHILHDVASGLQHIHNCGVVHLGNLLSLLKCILFSLLH